MLVVETGLLMVVIKLVVDVEVVTRRGIDTGMLKLIEVELEVAGD